MDCLIIRITDDRVTVTRFGLSGKTATLDGSALFELDEGQNLAAVASRIASGINGSPRVVMCLAPSLFAQRIVELPLGDLRKVREVLPAQLQGEISLPVETVVFDALPLREGKFLALWARKSDISHAIDLFRDAGIEPEIVSAEPFSWSFLPGAPEDCLVCDGSALAIIEKGRVGFLRAFSGGMADKQLPATLSALEMSGITLPARLFTLGDQAAEAFSGGSSTLPAEPLALPHELVPLFKNDMTFHQLAGQYAVALAVRAGALPDFRRGDLAWTTGDARLRGKLRLTAILTILAVLLLFSGLGLRYQAARKDIASLDNSITAMYREVFPARTKAVDELAEIKGEIRKLTGSGSSGGVLDVLKQLAEAKGSGINGLYEAEIEGKAVRLKGDARSAQAVTEFKSALSPLMATVEVGELKSRPDGGVTFSMAASLREGKQ